MVGGDGDTISTKVSFLLLVPREGQAQKRKMEKS